MLKRILLSSALIVWQLDASAADLLEVYQKAFYCDPIFRQAVAQTLVTKDNVPISIASILPNISFLTNPAVARYGFSGSEYRIGSINGVSVFNPRNLTQRTNTVDLTLTQPIFNFSLFGNIVIQLKNAKSACATLNAALQSLMVRVSNAYFAVLRDEEYLSYTLAAKRYYQFQRDQVTHQFQVGLRTITDVYTAQAAYDSAIAMYIVAKKTIGKSS